MIDYYISVLKNYIKFTGRARRSEYWYFMLCNGILYLIFSVVSMMIKFPYVHFIYLLAVLLPTLAVSVRRVHDINKAGWFILIPLYDIVLFCTVGDKGKNRFGEDPIPSTVTKTETKSDVTAAS